MTCEFKTLGDDLHEGRLGNCMGRYRVHWRGQFTVLSCIACGEKRYIGIKEMKNYRGYPDSDSQNVISVLGSKRQTNVIKLLR